MLMCSCSTERSILRTNRDSFFLLQSIESIRRSSICWLERNVPDWRSMIHERRLAVIDVRNDRNVTNLIHRREAYRAGKQRSLR